MELIKLFVENCFSSIEVRSPLFARVCDQLQAPETVLLHVVVLTGAGPLVDQLSSLPHDLLILVCLIPELATVYRSPDFVHGSHSSHNNFVVEEDEPASWSFSWNFGVVVPLFPSDTDAPMTLGPNGMVGKFLRGRPSCTVGPFIVVLERFLGCQRRFGKPKGRRLSDLVQDLSGGLHGRVVYDVELCYKHNVLYYVMLCYIGGSDNKFFVRKSPLSRFGEHEA